MIFFLLPSLPRTEGGAVVVHSLQRRRRTISAFPQSVGGLCSIDRFANMPMFIVNTNVAKSDVPAALLSEATEELAKALGKPVQVGRTFELRRLVPAKCQVGTMTQEWGLNSSPECNTTSVVLTAPEVCSLVLGWRAVD